MKPVANAGVVGRRARQEGRQEPGCLTEGVPGAELRLQAAELGRAAVWQQVSKRRERACPKFCVRGITDAEEAYYAKQSQEG